MLERLLPPATVAATVLLLAAPPPAVAVSVERVTVDHAFVDEAAKRLASEAYRAPAQAPRFFRELNYDDYRKIEFRREETLWADGDLPFRVQFFHPGYIHAQIVKLNEFTATHSQEIPFSLKMFDYHEVNVPLFSRWGLGFAGFRVLNPVNEKGKWDEVLSFLGASYFRALGRGQIYGISARGLALNAGGPAAEEFPAFTEFWLGKPDAGAATMTIHALLDSQSVTGAYTFTVSPGTDTVVEVHATLHFRRQVDLPGLAPLSTMFWFGEGSGNRFGDFRPEVHDSDGLLVATDHESRIWRPLLNPRGLLRTDFPAPALAGFGVLQRDRDHRSYQDFEAHYQRRPGVWIEPVGSWPAGRIHLVEMPTADEYHDNVAAFWTPDAPIAPGKPFDLAWRMHWTNEPRFGGPPGWVSATRRSVQDGGPTRTRYVVDFDPGSLSSVPASAPVRAEVTATNGAKVEHSNIFHNPHDGSLRLVILLSAPASTPRVDVRARLLLDNKPLTETWNTVWEM